MKNLDPPSPQNQRWQNGPFLPFGSRGFILDLWGWEQPCTQGQFALTELPEEAWNQVRAINVLLSYSKPWGPELCGSEVGPEDACHKWSPTRALIWGERSQVLPELHLHSTVHLKYFFGTFAISPSAAISGTAGKCNKFITSETPNREVGRGGSFPLMLLSSYSFIYFLI